MTCCDEKTLGVGVAATAAETGPPPTAFSACTVTSYAVPGVRPIIVQPPLDGNAVQLTLAPPPSGVAVATYRMIGEPPAAASETGSHVTANWPGPGTTRTLVGATEGVEAASNATCNV